MKEAIEMKKKSNFKNIKTKSLKQSKEKILNINYHTKPFSQAF